MNKTQLVDVVAAKAELKKKEAEAAVSAVVAAITEALEAGEKVQLSGLGTFEVKERAERTGRCRSYLPFRWNAVCSGRCCCICKC